MTRQDGSRVRAIKPRARSRLHAARTCPDRISEAVSGRFCGLLRLPGDSTRRFPEPETGAGNADRCAPLTSSVRALETFPQNFGMCPRRRASYPQEIATSVDNDIAPIADLSQYHCTWQRISGSSVVWTGKPLRCTGSAGLRAHRVEKPEDGTVQEASGCARKGAMQRLRV